jgi:hypothetical protein
VSRFAGSFSVGRVQTTGEAASIKMNLAEVVASVGLIPAALIGSIGMLNYDLVSHQRLKTLKDHGLPGGRQAQKMLATRLFGYGRKVKSPTRISELEGESFAAAVSGETFGGEQLKDMETGRLVSSREPMAIPLGAASLRGGARSAAMARFRKQLKNRELVRVGKGLLVLRKTQESHMARASAGRAARGSTRIVGVLLRGRTQRPMLGFYRAFDAILPTHMGKYEKAMEQSLTAAGREAMEGRNTVAEAMNAARIAVMRKYLAANPGNVPAARRAANRAAADVRRSALGIGRRA